jgi:hypothetical protein
VQGLGVAHVVGRFPCGRCFEYEQSLCHGARGCNPAT